MLNNLKCPNCRSYALIKGFFFDLIGRSEWSCKKCEAVLQFSSSRSKAVATLLCCGAIFAFWGFVVLNLLYKILIVLLYISFPFYWKVERK